MHVHASPCSRRHARAPEADPFTYRCPRSIVDEGAPCDADQPRSVKKAQSPSCSQASSVVQIVSRVVLWAHKHSSQCLHAYACTQMTQNHNGQCSHAGTITSPQGRSHACACMTDQHRGVHNAWMCLACHVCNALRSQYKELKRSLMTLRPKCVCVCVCVCVYVCVQPWYSPQNDRT